jgi:hypothetical protein
MVFNKFKINPNGVVKARIFALLLLLLSTSLILSAHKSLGRYFNGTLFKKEKIDNFYTTGYILYLMPPGVDETSFAEEIIGVLSEQKPKLHRVGVSSFVYEAASELVRVSKLEYSPFIFVGQERYFDKGIFWTIWALLGIYCSIMMYHQTLLVDCDNCVDKEEISVPGLN